MQEHNIYTYIKEKKATIELRLPFLFAYVKVDPPIEVTYPYISAGRLFNSINRTIPAFKRIFCKEYHFSPAVINHKTILEQFANMGRCSLGATTLK